MTHSAQIHIAAFQFTKQGHGTFFNFQTPTFELYTPRKQIKTKRHLTKRHFNTKKVSNTRPTHDFPETKTTQKGEHYLYAIRKKVISLRKRIFSWFFH